MAMSENPKVRVALVSDEGLWVGEQRGRPDFSWEGPGFHRVSM